METECFAYGNKVETKIKGEKAFVKRGKALRFTETTPAERGGNGVLGTGECEGDSTG